LTMPSDRGLSEEEKLVRCMKANLEKDAEVAGWAPGRIWAAGMRWVPMIGTLRGIKDSEELGRWLDERHVAAIYIDNDFRANEAQSWAYLKELIGSKLELAITERDLELFIVKPTKNDPPPARP
jgi:hypothetical protein